MDNFNVFCQLNNLIDINLAFFVLNTCVKLISKNLKIQEIVYNTFLNLQKERIICIVHQYRRFIITIYHE